MQKKKMGSLQRAKNVPAAGHRKHFHKADGTTTYVELKGDMVLDGVDFGYNDDKIVLHDIKMYATPGQKIAFVGSTGAGKTTITNLLNRFYDIQDGKIRYDGINVNKIKKGRFTPFHGNRTAGYQLVYSYGYGKYPLWKTGCHR